MNDLVRRLFNIIGIDIHDSVGRIIDRVVGARDIKIRENVGADHTWSRHCVQILLIKKGTTSNKNLATTKINLATSLKNGAHFGMSAHAIVSLVTANLRIVLHESVDLEVIVPNAYNRATLDDNRAMMEAQLRIVIVGETISHGLL